RDTKSRVCDDLLPRLGPQAAEQGAGAGAQDGVAPLGRDLSQGNEHKGAPVRFRMGQNEGSAAAIAAGPAQTAAAIVQDVDVERARSQAAAGTPSGLAFEALNQAQQGRWRQRCLGDEDGIEIVGLATAADGFGAKKVG